MMATQSRRQFLRAATILGGGGAVALVSHAQDTGSTTLTSDLVTSDAQAVIDKGLNFLAVNQAADGSFADSQAGLGNVAITGLAGLALMAGGHQPGRGRYGYVVSRAADYIVSRGGMNPGFPGYLNNTNTTLSTGSMYQHGFGALFLAEVYGMLPDVEKQKRLRNMLEKAIGLTRNAQNREGGWRYTPTPEQADVSVTVAQLMALRAAKNAGVTVPKSVIDKCVAYIKACQLGDGGSPSRSGSNRDQPSHQLQFFLKLQRYANAKRFILLFIYTYIFERENSNRYILSDSIIFACKFFIKNSCSNQ